MEIHLQIKLNRPHIRMQRRFVAFEALVLTLVLLLTGAVSHLRADTGTCGGAMITLPFTDILNGPSSGFFCFIAQIYFQGITAGTSATTYSPDNPVTRGQMAVFLARTEDLALKRGSRRAALNQWWTPQATWFLRKVGRRLYPFDVVCNDDELVVVNNSGSVSLVRASHGTIENEAFQFTDGTPLIKPRTAVVADGIIYVAGGNALGYFVPLDRAESFGSDIVVNLVSKNFSPDLQALTFDGSFVWTGSSSGVVGKVLVTDNSVTTVGSGSGFGTVKGMLFDGSSVWITSEYNSDPSFSGPFLRRLDSNGFETLGIFTGTIPSVGRPVFDGTNIWVPNTGDNTVAVIRATTGAVLAQLSGNGLNGPVAAAFDGQRIAVTNFNSNTISLWKATDLTPLGSFIVDTTNSQPFGICSDGVNFWVTLSADRYLVRF